MKNLLVLLISILITDCGSSVVTAGRLGQLNTSEAASASPGPTYNYAGDSASYNGNCWENNIVTNGPSYGQSSNSGYYCTGGGVSYGTYPGATLWVGFYTDGTMSVSDQTGTNHVYTIMMPLAPGAVAGKTSFAPPGIVCEADLSLNGTPSIIMSKANYPGIPTTVLDANNHLQYMEMQTFVNGILDSGSIWTCTYQSSFGTVQ